MLVTITTDAAFHPQHQAAGYAFWIACDAGRYAYSGNFRAKVKRPEIAEFKCIWCDQNAKMKMWDAIKSKTS